MQTINREARKTSGRGLGLQRTRAVHRLLTLIREKGHRPVYCATEFMEDSLTFVATEKGAELILEENKNYSSALSFNSDEIKNTLVAFADQYIRYFSDPDSLDFSIFCLAKIANESIENVKIQSWYPDFIPETSKRTSFNILEKLYRKEELSDIELNVAKGIFLEEYKKQYSVIEDVNGEKTVKVVNNFDRLLEWKIEDFARFLYSLNLFFGDISDEKFESMVIDEIKSCEFYNYKLAGLERELLSILENTFDKRQQNESIFSRFVSRADVENIFIKMASNSEEYKPIDPSWEVFIEMTADDQRNLKKKYQDVCNEINVASIHLLSLKATLSRKNEVVFANEYISLRCKVFIWCSEFINSKGKRASYTSNELDTLLNEMVELCYTNLIDLKKTYRISINDKDNIKGIILSLIDDCYLSYDELNI